MNFTSNFIVGSINTYTLTDPNDKGGVNGQDPISSQTAWLYTQFTNGTLSNYDYNNTGNWRLRQPPGVGECAAACVLGLRRRRGPGPEQLLTSSSR